MKKRNPEKFKFSIIQLTFWCSWCSFTSFAAMYFKHKGLTESQIGFAISLSTAGGILGLFFWGFLCDKFRTIKKNFILANILIWAAVMSFLFLNSPLPIIMMMFILGFSQVPQPSILDTWILKKLPDKEEEYGHIRLWASVGFGIFALIFGWIINKSGFKTMFIATTFFIAITLFFAFRSEDADEGRDKISLKKSFKALFTNRKYLFFILICFIIGLAFRTTHLLLPLIIDSVKGNSGHLGFAYFIGLMAEIPVLIASKKFAKQFKSLTLIAFSGILFLIHFIILYLAQNAFLVIVSMIAQGLAFGNYLPSVRLFVFENAPKELRTSAQTFQDAITSCLTAAIGSAAGGVIIQNYGIRTVLFIGMGLLVLAVSIILLKIVFMCKNRRT